jgi:hypothetical protein
MIFFPLLLAHFLKKLALSCSSPNLLKNLLHTASKFDQLSIEPKLIFINFLQEGTGGDGG